MADSSEWEPLMQKITAKLSSTLTQLHQIWEEIGYNHEVRSIYCKQVFDHIEDLLGDMVSESKLKKETILVNVKNLMDQIGVLTKELGTNITNAGYENLSLKEVEEALRVDLQNLQYCKTQRLTHLKKLLAKEKSLCKVLGIQPINIEEKLPSEEELKSFELYLEKQEGEKCRLEAIFNEQRRAIVRMMDDLGTSPSSSFQHIVYEDDENYVFSNSNMSKLKELREELEHKVNSAKEHVVDIRQELIALWKYLNEPEHICQSFLSSYEGYSVATINALTTELERCKEKRKQNIAKYVSQVRSELVKLWDLCKFSEQQRKEFIYFYSHTYTEDLLTLHELEVKRVQEFYDSNKSIYELLQERDDLWTKMKELLQRANNPDRFYNRGGQLLMEEKERKTIQKKLPKIEEQLRNLIKEYENMHEEIFTINGMSVEELLKESWEHLNEEKESIKKARKEGKDKSAKKATPIVSKIPSKLALSSSKKFSIRRHTPLNFSKRKLFCSPSPNTSIKRRNRSIGASGSKSKRNSKGTSSKKVSKQKNKNENSMLQSSTATDTTYSKFEEHLEDKKELRSSLLPEKVLADASKSKSKSRRRSIRTPAKPLRKNLPLPKTPTTSESSQLQLHKSPRSPRLAQPSRLATISTPLPIIF